MKSIYTTYKERWVEIGGKNSIVFSKKGNTKFSYDIGELLGCDEKLFDNFIKSFWNRVPTSYPLINKENVKQLYINSNYDNDILSSVEYLELKSKDEAEAKKYLLKNRNKAIKKLIDTQVTSFSKLQNLYTLCS